MELPWSVMGIISFGLLFILLMIGIPVGFSLITAAMISVMIVGGGPSFLYDIPGYFFHHLNSFTLTCVPLFVLMAIYAQKAGFGNDLFLTLRIWLRGLPGSLNVVGIAACAIFAAIAGNSVTVAAAVGLVALPEYKKYGYDAKLSVGSIAGGGGLGILIPPSVPMIMYCVICDQSIGLMFSGGILPGIMTAGIFMVYVVIRCLINPQLAPPIPREDIKEIHPVRALLNVVPIVVIIICVLATIYLGIATATEAAGLGCFGTIVLALLYGKMKFMEIVMATYDGVRIMAFIILIFLGAIVFGHALVRGNVAEGLCNYIVALGVSKEVVIAAILGVLLFLGCFMDATPITLTTMPILFPLAMKYKIDPIFFGVICVMMLETAALTPPVGFNLFVLRGIGREYVTMNEIIRGAFPFVLLYILAIMIVMIFPDIILYLPNKMRG
ncbi:MAG: TRAP transporter large permease subunit [Candidatus Helarchaeota archaeon]|nr:TRAP transporter large permease subunit [Candidatus Helarchaeota archaeon]